MEQQEQVPKIYENRAAAWQAFIVDRDKGVFNDGSNIYPEARVAEERFVIHQGPRTSLNYEDYDIVAEYRWA